MKIFKFILFLSFSIFFSLTLLTAPVLTPEQESMLDALPADQRESMKMKMSETNSVENSSYRMPTNTTTTHAMKLSIVEDKPIMMDYWKGSLDKTVLIGLNENGEKLLVKSDEEYTSTVAKIYKVGSEYIIMTENSIYLVDNQIQLRRISA